MKTDKKELVLDIIEKGRFNQEENRYCPIESAEDFIVEYERRNKFRISQGTVSKWFKELNIIKVLDTQSKNKYYKVVEKNDDNEDVEIKTTLKLHCNSVTNIINKGYGFALRCDVGTEANLCMLLSEKFANKFFALIPAYGSVIVVCRNQKNAYAIKRFVKAHYNKS